MVLGNILRNAASLVDTATDKVTETAAKFKDNVANFSSDEKQWKAYNKAIQDVEEHLESKNMMTSELNHVLRNLRGGNPYGD